MVRSGSCAIKLGVRDTAQRNQMESVLGGMRVTKFQWEVKSQYQVAELRDKASKAKDATVKAAVDTKDRHSSVPLKNTNWDPYNKTRPPPPPPPTNKYNKPAPPKIFGPPPQRGGESAPESPAPSTSPAPGPPPIVRPSAGAGARGPPPIVRPSVKPGAAGPPPIVRSTRPSMPSTASSSAPDPPVRAPVLSRFQQSEPEAEIAVATPPPPIRRFGARAAEKDIDWANLSAEDKEFSLAGSTSFLAASE
ncbi:hypothetical protein K438DRAFT_1766616 [Mycena galopus ATCC 62051]|nr:hypothetical protein K438DRAFT_1766616 [Mycena galopus ATCC 62051]